MNEVIFETPIKIRPKVVQKINKSNIKYIAIPIKLINVLIDPRPAKQDMFC